MWRLQRSLLFLGKNHFYCLGWCQEEPFITQWAWARMPGVEARFLGFLPPSSHFPPPNPRPEATFPSPPIAGCPISWEAPCLPFLPTRLKTGISLGASHLPSNDQNPLPGGGPHLLVFLWASFPYTMGLLSEPSLPPIPELNTWLLSVA